MSTCNYCTFRRIRKSAKEKGFKVTILNDAKWHPGGGKNVYVHPRNIQIHKLGGGEDGEREKYRVAWMMEIPETCQC